MKGIGTQSDLAEITAKGEGLVYNDVAPGGSRNVLHSASCHLIVIAAGPNDVRADHTAALARKLFFGSDQEAAEWLTANRGPEGANWRRCRSCRSKVVPVSSTASAAAGTARSQTPAKSQRVRPTTAKVALRAGR